MHKLIYSVVCLLIIAYGVVGAVRDKSVRVIYTKPTDKSYNYQALKEITNAALHVHYWYYEKLGNKTFRLNTPIVEQVPGEQNERWYINTSGNPWGYIWNWWSNTRKEVRSKLGTQDWDMNYRIPIYTHVAKPQGASGAANYGYFVVDDKDIEGLLGQTNEPVPRWWGGFAHELGHCFTCPDHSVSGCLMSAAMYRFPNCTFCNACKDDVLRDSKNRGFFTDTCGFGEPENAVVWIYTEKDQKGYKTAFVPGTYHCLDMMHRGLINNEASSIKVAQGCKVTLYKNDSLAGTSKSFTTDDNDLANDNLNNNVSSLKIEKSSSIAFGLQQSIGIKHIVTTKDYIRILLHLDGMRNLDISLFSSKGVLIKKVSVSNTDKGERLVRINRQSYSPGVYFCDIMRDNSHLVRRIILR